jgi:hypothetical protein
LSCLSCLSCAFSRRCCSCTCFRPRPSPDEPGGAGPAA